MSAFNIRVPCIRRLAIACVLCSTAVAIGDAQTTAASYQADAPTEVTFHLLSNYGDAPLKLARVLVGDKEVPLDTPVPVTGMWLRHVKVVVQNISSKTAVEGYITLTYPETGTGTKEQPTLGSTIAVGRLPERWYLQKDGTMRPHGPEAQVPEINVGTGSTITFGSKADENADRDQIRGVQMAGRLTRVDIAMSKFWFSDGTVWKDGLFLLPAPPPVLWKQVTSREFYSYKVGER